MHLNTGFVSLGTTLSGLLVNAHVLVAQHFERRRRTACSLACTICGFYSVVFPSLAELFRSTYGTRGAFLLHGAILMNAIPLAITVRSPPKPILTGDDRHESLYAKDCGASFCALREHTAEARNIESSLNPAEQIGGESSAEDDGVVCATRLMLLASALMGATSGSRIALQAPALVHDFGLENLPILMGAASSCMGVASMLRPPFVGKTNVFVEAYVGFCAKGK
ncbi:hypothetical protein HPB49_012517 [Dermacentor silvarum]|uniref:Uncharacterized protein n=1 Tax=Dermacentor silvarum TaxID=543639 RepID=A0ACB8C964_DERSI|nr:hypothetical protein HPB49_012517 [Dermacentor silvarum]